MQLAQYRSNLLTRPFIFKSQSEIGHSCLLKYKISKLRAHIILLLRYRADSPDLNATNTSVPIDPSRPWRWCALCMSAFALRLRVDQMTSHKSYNEPGPRLIGPFYSARLSVSPRRFFVSSRVEVPSSSPVGPSSSPPVSSLPRFARAPLVQFGRWQSIHPSRPRTPSIQTIPGYSRDNEKALSLRAFEGTCGIRAGAHCAGPPLSRPRKLRNNGDGGGGDDWIPRFSCLALSKSRLRDTM